MKTLTLDLPNTALAALERVRLNSSCTSTSSSLVIGTLSVAELEPAGIVTVPLARL